MNLRGPATMLAILACAQAAWGQQARRDPDIGYVYPAGGRQGTTVRVIVGGQTLRAVTDAYVTGTGVRAKVVKTYRPVRSLNKDQRDELRRRMLECSERRWAELVKAGRVKGNPPWRRAGGRTPPKPQPRAEKVEVPEHPLLEDLETKSLRELAHIRHVLMGARKGQFNAQISETVLLEVAIDPDAPPGDRELRLGGRAGLTDPVLFQVGELPESRELENNDPGAVDPLPEGPPLELPVLVNGQVLPGDVDRIRFRAAAGQRLVIRAQARHLVPFLADAVPGWFQAVLAVYDAAGKELAFADDYRFDPDPVLLFEVPADGVYELEVRDSIYRGREDFVYRVALGELPFIAQVFPLGGRAGEKTVASIDGWNLATDRLRLATDAAGIRQTAPAEGRVRAGPVVYASDTLPECTETEPNDDPDGARKVTLPIIVNGRIDRPGDADAFRFEGKEGDEVVAEVTARRLRSPLDSLLRLTDASGKVIAWNDDHMLKAGHLHRDMGVLTHHADSYLRARLPAHGVYEVRLTDAQDHGGEAHAYRLRISPPRPSFDLYVTPSSINVPGGRVAPVAVHVVRKDGFDGPVDVALVDAPRGFALSGPRVPAGRDSVRMTLSAAGKRPEKAVTLKLEGRARIGGQRVTVPATPADDVMQAFLWRHLVPARTLMAAVVGGGRSSQPIVLAHKGPVRVPAGGTAEVHIKGVTVRPDQTFELALSEPPEGITLGKVKRTESGFALELRADKKAPVGLADNLIVEASMEVQWKPKDDPKTVRKRRVALGVLPAIAFEIVEK